MRRTKLGAVGLALLVCLLFFGVVGASGIKNVRMSDDPDGLALTDFPSGTETVYVVFQYLDLATETIRVRVYNHAGAVLLDQTDTYNGTGTASIAVAGGGRPFPDGPYVTTLYFASGYLSKALEWTVGGTDQPPTPTPASPTTLQVEPTSLTFEALQGGPNPPSQNVAITNGGGGLLAWSASKDANWLRIRPSSGIDPTLLRVSVNVDGLPADTYEGHITISGGPDVLNSPQTVSVTLTVLPLAGSATTAITPLPTEVWVVGGETIGPHLGEEGIRAGAYDGEVYHGAVQFDLSSVPPDARINAASVEFTGQSAEFLGNGGFWRLKLLDASVDEDGATHAPADIHEAPVVETLLPPLSSADLGAGVVNVFVFTADQLDLLEARLTNKAVSFRLDGPTGESEDNLFIWDSGYNADGRGARPVLRINHTLPPMGSVVSAPAK